MVRWHLTRQIYLEGRQSRPVVWCSYKEKSLLTKTFYFIQKNASEDKNDISQKTADYVPFLIAYMVITSSNFWVMGLSQ